MVFFISYLMLIFHKVLVDSITLEHFHLLRMFFYPYHAFQRKFATKGLMMKNMSKKNKTHGQDGSMWMLDIISCFCLFCQSLMFCTSIWMKFMKGNTSRTPHPMSPKIQHLILIMTSKIGKNIHKKSSKFILNQAPKYIVPQ